MCNDERTSALNTAKIGERRAAAIIRRSSLSFDLTIVVGHELTRLDDPRGGRLEPTAPATTIVAPLSLVVVAIRCARHRPSAHRSSSSVAAAAGRRAAPIDVDRRRDRS